MLRFQHDEQILPKFLNDVNEHKLRKIHLFEDVYKYVGDIIYVDTSHKLRDEVLHIKFSVLQSRLL